MESIRSNAEESVETKPALFIRRSSLPCSFFTTSASAFVDSSSPIATSTAVILMSGLVAESLQDFIVSESEDSERAVRTRPDAPAWTNTFAVAAPIPLLAPVMQATNGVVRDRDVGSSGPLGLLCSVLVKLKPVHGGMSILVDV